MQIKTTLRFHLTLVRIAIIKNTTNNRCWWGWGKRNPCTLPVGIQASTTTLENNMEICLKKTKHRSAIWSSNPTPRDVPKGMRLSLLQRQLHTHVYCSITIAKLWKQPRCPTTDKWI
jgi:hypothetical protein